MEIEAAQMTIIRLSRFPVPVQKKYRMEVSCLELALEGERLCKVGDYSAGVSFFEAAIQVGTEDLQVLSAIYSQLGNAYFHLHDYAKALDFHRHDLTLTRTIGDLLGEAKASGNLGNTLKVLGRFEEAVVCCQRHLDIARDVGDKVGQARALYNFGNVYHAKGKSISWSGAEPGEFPEEVMAALRRAAEFYEANLTIVKDLGDRAAQGRTYGNLGNTHYLLGNFRQAVASHEQRLLIAKEFGDRAAERRAYCNLGNAFIFLGEFEVAAEHYKRTLHLARQLKDRAVEAQACYSLGNTYTLLQDYERAIDYHLKHLIIAQDLNDRIGEGRACWSLGNAHTALGNHDQAMHFAEKHLEICRETGDRSGELTARMNVSDLQTVLGLSYSTNNSTLSENSMDNKLAGARSRLSRRHSMENLELMKLTPDKMNGQKWSSDILTKQNKPSMVKSSSKLFFVSRLRGKKHKSSSKVLQDTSNTPSAQAPQKRHSPDALGDEGFFDLLSRFQSNRMDDQRCSVQDKGSKLSLNSGPPSPPTVIRKSVSESADVSGAHSRRLEASSAVGGSLPGLRLNQNSSQAVLSHLMANADGGEPDDNFFDMLVKCQGSRLDDQRCAPPPPQARGPTVPDEDFFSLIMRSQAKRMDEQRVTLPSHNAARPGSS
ncbi:G-protein-signaling modulator 2-like isoform X2 [Synchiropus splendidus]|uniref:G-protein-signaling modulator 2-like isoform X2 n=2 Tax=Synchiropus splendidus TaxID=270530 RepID=UPI00237E4AAD|nr:G-protein-signaling modulator 2-like isoform X2 [Synchiropus splendidus]XP_053738612.1 G-protein-signaling modulator 2-like isoform X2 [Synchiropus splendidus]XP_053738613.1 G-protein-signaling modulator 2-like isoform X2 [Synchiropus splendidus]XP_053738614.1 G-protein-signaling modulator 2-like isoform X2 [Synchiropus splendidus]XP_053738615.1 G-protein-signaling modulator 2-like isoform X2 [Synchiropus splendidus]XP_053738616.1 G-protein-signaling modulator 2-like isoform X2 [Synchiropus